MKGGLELETAIIILILVLLLLVVLGYYLREKHFKTIDTLNQLKADIYNEDVDALFEQAEEVKFSGASQEKYDEVKNQWKNVQEINFPELSNAIAESEKSIETFRLRQAGKTEKEAEKIITETNREIFDIKNKINKFLEAAEKNQKEISEMHDEYQSLRKDLLTKSFNYGPAVPALEANFKDMEEEFNKFTVYTSKGDHVQARESLNSVKQMIKKTSNYMSRIPGYLNKIEEVYPKELAELRSGYKSLLDKRIAFANDSTLEDIVSTESKLENIYNYLEDLKLKEAQKEMKAVESKVDALYELMENEYQAQVKVNNQFSKLKAIFETLYDRNRQIKIETDRMSQLYHMTDATLSYGAKMEQEISSHEANYERIRNEVAQSDIIYSQLSSTMDKLFDKTQKMYDQQNTFLDDLYGLADEEEQVKQDLDLFARRMSELKHISDRSNLPGLPSDFYDYYHYITNRIKELAHELDRVRLDMQEIRYLYDIVKEDLPALEKQMDDMLYYAEATELIIQSLNKYRHEVPHMNEVFDMLSHYYYTENNYERAFSLAAETLSNIDASELDYIQQKLEDRK